MTTHRSQGLTMAEDPIGILSSRNATLASAYVQISRAVSGITIVTDSFDNLVRNISPARRPQSDRDLQRAARSRAQKRHAQLRGSRVGSAV
jgi:hypothetical protein